MNGDVGRKSEGRLERPDGGWGWLVVFGSMVVMILVSFCYAGFGLIFPAKLTADGVQTSSIAWLLSLQFAVASLMSPIAGPLATIYSHRKVVFTSGLLCGIGYILTAYAPSTLTMYITYPLFVGIGVGLATNTSFLLFTNYFEKRRGLANGFFVVGNSLGNALTPLLITFLLYEYRFQGTLLIVGALMLNICVCASIFHPVEWHLKVVVPGKDGKDRVRYVRRKKHEMATAGRKRNGFIQGDHPQRNRSRSRTYSLMSNILLPDIPEETSEEIDVETPTETKSIVFENKPVTVGDFVRPSYRRSVSAMTPSEYKRKREQTSVATSSQKSLSESVDFLEHIGNPFNSFGSLSSVYTAKYMEFHEQQPAERMKCMSLRCPVREVLKLIEFSLLKDPSYVNMALGSSLVFTAIPNMNMFLPMYLYSLGFDTEEVALCFTCVFVVDLVSKVFSSWLSDLGLYKRRHAFMLGSLLISATVFSLSFFKTYGILVACSSMYGAARGLVFANMSLMYGERYGIEKLPSAFGLAQLVLCAISLISSPLIGLVRDITGSFSLCLQLVALCPLICIVCWTVETVVTSCCRKKPEESPPPEPV